MRVPGVDSRKRLHAAILGAWSAAPSLRSHGSPKPSATRAPDPYEQAKRCLEVIVSALGELGATPEQVVRTRVFITDPADWEAVGRTHGEVFGDVRPASAMLVISALLDPAWKVEIEADAVVED